MSDLVETLQLKTPILKCLETAGIRTVDQLEVRLQHGRKIQGIGEERLRIIRSALLRYHQSNPKASKGSLWVQVIGAVSSLMTLVFFMLLVIISVLGYSIPDSQRFLVICVLSFGSAMSFGFLGGTAAASGKLTIPWTQSKWLDDHSIQFGLCGGVAVLVIMLALCTKLYANPKGIASAVRFRIDQPDQERIAKTTVLTTYKTDAFASAPVVVPKDRSKGKSFTELEATFSEGHNEGWVILRHNDLSNQRIYYARYDLSRNGTFPAPKVDLHQRNLLEH